MNHVLGIGNDIIEIERIRSSIEKYGDHFLDKLFTERERAFCAKFTADPAPHYAARFAAKEAVAKALGTGFGKELGWLDFEILSDEKGRPEVHCSHKMNEQFNDPTLLVSLSHCKSYAAAVVIWIKN